KRVGPRQIPFDVLAALVYYGEHHQRRHVAALRSRFKRSNVRGRLCRGAGAHHCETQCDPAQGGEALSI
ncbi:MAG: hypothetical protein ACXWCX_25320, partial [Burkholderiales bacterium]